MSTPTVCSHHSGSGSLQKGDEHSKAEEEQKHAVHVSDYKAPSSEDLDIRSGEKLDEAFRVAGKVAMEYTEEESRAVRRKIDKRIPLLCAAVYFSQYLDKTLLNYASITGLPIKGQEYNQVSAA